MKVEMPSAMSSGPRAVAFARPRADHALLRVTRAADHMKGITPSASSPANSTIGEVIAAK